MLEGSEKTAAENGYTVNFSAMTIFLNRMIKIEATDESNHSIILTYN